MKLKEWIKKNNVSIQHFAKKLGVTRQHVYHLINGKSAPSLKIAFLIQKETNGKVDVAQWN